MPTRATAARYLLRAGELLQLSIDHTWGEEAIQAGRPAEEIAQHPNRGVLKRYLGIEPVVQADTRFRLGAAGAIVDTLTSPLRVQPGDVVMLCSDGLADGVPNAELRQALQAHDLTKAAKNLVACALRAGTGDNITAVVLRAPGAGAVPAAAGRAPRRWIGWVAALVIVLALAVAAALLLPGLMKSEPLPAPASGPTPAATVASPVSQPPATRGAVPTGEGQLVVATTEASQPGEALTAASGGAVVEPTLLPTYTPVPTATRIPTRRPTATAYAVSATSVPYASPAQSGPGVRLFGPVTGSTVQGEATFRWEALAGFSLGTGKLYELVFWRPGEEPGSGLSPTEASTLTSVRVPLAQVDNFPNELGALIEPGPIFWSVFLFDPSAPAGRQRVKPLADPKLFVYVRASTATEVPGPTPTDPKSPLPGP